MSVPSMFGERVVATREATRDLWGTSTVERVLASLDPAIRTTFVAGVPIPRWVPDAYFIAWMTALWAGPCDRDTHGLARWVDRQTDRGFGTTQRMLMSLASPWVLLRRAHALWRTEHTHGQLSVVRLGDRRANLVLRDHPFVTDDVGRIAISEAFRYLVYRCRVRGASEVHEVTPDGALVVTIDWG